MRALGIAGPELDRLVDEAAALVKAHWGSVERERAFPQTRGNTSAKGWTRSLAAASGGSAASLPRGTDTFSEAGISIPYDDGSLADKLSWGNSLIRYHKL